MEYNYSKKSIWKWILLYVVIAAVAYGAVYYFWSYKKGGYSYSPQNYQNQNQIAEWKTYQSEKLGFSFQYPSDFQLQESDISPGVMGEQGIFIVRKFNNLNQELSGLEKILSDVENTKNVVKKDTYINGIAAKDFSYEELYLKPMSYGPFYEISIYIPDKNINIFVQTTNHESIKTFRSIISTFKFTK